MKYPRGVSPGVLFSVPNNAFMIAEKDIRQWITDNEALKKRAVQLGLAAFQREDMADVQAQARSVHTLRTELRVLNQILTGEYP